MRAAEGHERSNAPTADRCRTEAFEQLDPTSAALSFPLGFPRPCVGEVPGHTPLREPNLGAGLRGLFIPSGGIPFFPLGLSFRKLKESDEGSSDAGLHGHAAGGVDRVPEDTCREQFESPAP